MLDGPGEFLLNPAVWKNLGDRGAWVSFGPGFERGRWVGRRACALESLPLKADGQASVKLRWTDHRAQVKCDFVPVQHLLPAFPQSKDLEGVVLTGSSQGELVTVMKYSRKTKSLRVRGGCGRVWEEQGINVCQVEILELRS